MLVRFVSSESGELMMFADVARQILTVLGKECTARGVFTAEEMLPAAARLKKAVAQSDAAPPAANEKDDGEETPTLSQRAWPFIEMLERSAAGGKGANIVWTAAADF